MESKYHFICKQCGTANGPGRVGCSCWAKPAPIPPPSGTGEMTVCRGCGHLSVDEITAPALACCPDSDYIPIRQFIKELWHKAYNQAELTRLRAVGEAVAWKKVSKILPPDDVLCLVYREDRDQYDMGHYKSKNNIWATDGLHDKDDYSHWMLAPIFTKQALKGGEGGG